MNGEDRYRQLFDTAPIPMWETTFGEAKRRVDELRRSGHGDIRSYFESHADELRELGATVRVRDANRAALDLYGIESIDEFTTRKAEIFTERSTEVFIEELALIADGAVRFTLDQHHRDVNGRDIIIDLHFFVPDEFRDTYDRVNVAGIDVTERRRAERATALNEERWQLALDGAGHGVWDLDLVNNTVFVSRSVTSMLGLRSEPDGNAIQQWHARIHPDDLPQVLADNEKHFRGDAPEYRGEYRLRNDDGAYIWVLDRGRIAASDADGRPTRAVGTFTDITDRKTAENTVAALLAEKELLLRESHHRVKNNLTIIRSLLSLQARSYNDSDCVAVLEQAAARVQSMITLYEVLFGSDHDNELNLNEYLGSLVHELVGQFETTTRVRTVLEIDDIVLNARTVAPLGILVNEIITNSLKHAFADTASPEIRVSARRHGSDVTIVCSDNGPGIAGDVTLEESESFGLQLIHLLAAQIDASLSLSRTDGTRYTVTFPA